MKTCNAVFTSVTVALTLSMLLGACQTACDYDRDCPLDRVCGSDGFCTSNCTYPEGQCGSGMLCVDGKCQTACSSNGDCPTNYCAPSGICSTKSVADAMVQHDSTSTDANSTSTEDNSTSTDTDSTSDDSNNNESHDASSESFNY